MAAMFTVEGRNDTVVLRGTKESELPLDQLFSPEREWNTESGKKQIIYDIFVFYFGEHTRAPEETLAYPVAEAYFQQYRSIFASDSWSIARWQLDLWFYDWIDSQRKDKMLFAQWAPILTEKLLDTKLRPNPLAIIRHYIEGKSILEAFELQKEDLHDSQ